MKLIFLLFIGINLSFAQIFQPSQLPFYQEVKPNTDWLISNQIFKAEIYQTSGGKDIVLSNGLIKRQIRISPNAATIDFKNLRTNEQFIRSVRPEARITIDGKTYNIGGLYGQKEHAYLLTEWIEKLESKSNDFQYKTFKIKPLTPHVNFKSRTWAMNQQNPKGKELELCFESNLPELKGVLVSVHYEIFDNIPTICKWVSVENKGDKSLKINQLVNEILATPEEEIGRGRQPRTNEKTTTDLYRKQLRFQ
jgi:hypothetical protein